MYRRAGFTIIEFVIAVAISVILVSVGVPRYNSFVQRQDFIASTQRIQTCLQRAQQAAVGPSTGTPIRYSQMILSFNTGTSLYTCVVATYNSATPTVEVAEIYRDASISKLSVTSIAADSVSSELVFPMRVVFGVLENGAPLQLYNGVPGPPIKDSPGGRGFLLQITSSSTELSGTRSVITMERLGAPIQLTVQNPTS